jgi:hypothetical protein
MSIGTDMLMALLQTRMQGLKQESLTSNVSTSGGSIGVDRFTLLRNILLRVKYYRSKIFCLKIPGS